MKTRFRATIRIVVAAWIVILANAGAWAQGPTIDTPDLGSPGSGASPFGRTPGGGGAGPAGAPDSLLGGRAGPSSSKGVSTAISTPGMTMGSSLFAQQGVAPTANNPSAKIPASGALGLPPTEEDPGPEYGLTLDQAIERVVRENLDLKSKFFEIPQAKADMLTASLRANPVFYADAQLVPYGQYTRERPGGQTQYDINISYPARPFQEATGADRVGRPGGQGHRSPVPGRRPPDDRQPLLGLCRRPPGPAGDRVLRGRADRAQREVAQGHRGTMDEVQGEEEERRPARSGSRSTWPRSSSVDGQDRPTARPSRRSPPRLNIPTEQADAIELRGTLKYAGMVTLPPIEEMMQIALANRPDIIAYRLGVERAKSDVKLQYANRFQDVYLLAQPYTLQDNTPFGLKSPTSWALGRDDPAAALQPEPGEHPAGQAERDADPGRAVLDRSARRSRTSGRPSRSSSPPRPPSSRIETPRSCPTPRILLNEATRLFPSRDRRSSTTSPRSRITTTTRGPISIARSGSAGRCSTSTRRLASGSCLEARPDPIEDPPTRGRGALAKAGSPSPWGSPGGGIVVGGARFFSADRGFGSGAGHQALDDDGEVAADVGEAVEVVLALAAGGDDPAVAEQGEVVADGRLALAELRAEGADVLLAVGEDQDHLEPGRVADVLQEDRGPLGLLRTLGRRP